MKQKGNKKGFTGCAQAYIRKLQEEGRFSTAHVYKTRFFHSPNFALLPTLHSDRSPAII